MVSNSTSPMRLLAVAVGNSRTRWSGFLAREAEAPGVEANALAPGAVVSAAAALSPDVIALASVNEPVAGEITRSLAGAGHQVLRIGRDVHPPLRHRLDDASTLGMDRVLTAVGAFALVGEACAVIDAGTAITVDFVDGEGTFHGGAIAPGLNMMLRALHEQTAALPMLRFETQDPGRGPFGRDTAHAMQLGVAAAARGLVRDLVERYAEFYEAYPRVIATGGDAGIFEGDGLVERIIPDLQLTGIQRTIETWAGSDDEPG